MSFYGVLKAWFLSLVIAIPVCASSENRIWVYGKRKERYRENHAGKSVKLKPVEPSRLFSDTHLKEDASTGAVETGQSSASGFSLPKIRGQDQKLTEVWVEGTLVHDPWEGLPLASELDLLAFGELSMIQGVSPADFLSLNPIGSLRYSIRKLGKSRSKLGVIVGDPYGLNLYTRTYEHWNKGAVHGSSLLYGRSYQTNGKYTYYQDHGNPYDTSSGSYEERANNDQRSWQLMPYTALKMGRHYLSLFGLFHQSNNGIPGFGSFLSLARQRQKGGLLSTSYAYNFAKSTNAIVPTSLKLGAYYRDDSVHTIDPQHPLLGLEVKETRVTKVKRIDTGFLWEKQVLTINSKLQCGESELSSFQNQNAIISGKRSHIQGVLSSALSPIDRTSIEIKVLNRFQEDRFSKKIEAYQVNDDSQPLNLSHRMLAYSLAGSAQGDSHLTYLQTAFYQRPPTIFEEFGDGNRVVPSLSLTPETIPHHEIGSDFQFFTKKLNLHLGAFVDETKEKISFVPALSYTYIAKNIEKTLVKGAEAALELNIYNTVALASYTYLDPRIVSKHLTGRMVPGLSQDRFVLALAQYLNSQWSVRMRANYRSEAYRDVENSIVVPAMVSYDASGDYRHPLVQGYEFGLGISVVNLTDIKTMPVTSPYDTSRSGQVAYSDVDGYPLPGRQWMVHIGLEF